MKSRAICDTSTLISLYHLGLVEKLILLYDEVLIPIEVEYEFLNNAQLKDSDTIRMGYLLNTFSKNATWLKKCTDYQQEDIDLHLMAPGIDKGEAEVFAQYQSKGAAHQLLLDDRKARVYAQNLKMNIRGVLKILALFDIQLKICDYYNAITKLCEIGFHFTPNLVETIYNEVVNERA